MRRGHARAARRASADGRRRCVAGSPTPARRSGCRTRSTRRPTPLIDQSLHSRLGAETTNGDGFGVGWYGAAPDAGRVPRHRAGLERREPARAGGAHHVAAVLRPHPRLERHGGPADQLPPVPPRPLAVDAQRAHQRLPGGQARPGARRRPVAVTRRSRVRPTRRCCSTSRSPSGSRTTRPRRWRGAVGLVEAAGRRRGVEHPFQGTIATTDGERLWVFRYSSEGRSRSLFLTTDVPTLRAAVPRAGAAGAPVGRDAPRRLRAAGRPPGAVEELPEASYAVIAGGHADILPFVPAAQPRAAAPRARRGRRWPRPDAPRSGGRRGASGSLRAR